MQDNNIHIDKQSDVISENIRQKLTDFEMPVDATCWDEIEARLAANKKKKIIPFWWWLSGGAAVATLALLFVLQPFGETGNLALKNEHQSVKSDKNQILVQKTEVEAIRKTLASLTEKPVKASRFSKPLIVRVTENPAVETRAVTTANQLLTTNENVQKVNIVSVAKDTVMLIASNQTADVDSTAVSTAKKHLPNSLVDKSADEPIAKKKEKDGWLLAASFGPSGATAFNSGESGNYLSFANGEKNLGDVETNYASVMAPTDFTDITYNPALSFGLLARRNLGKTFSVESGLMYTYLSSSFKQSAFFTTDATLTLHYLGLPVNLIVRLWENKKWQLYVAGGGMVEKGLRSVYNQRQIIGNQTRTTTANSNIDGLQWSVNSGIGLTYKIQPKMGLYFEPKFSYFFDNNQPVSTRTNQPSCFGLTAGLRFEL